MLSLGTFGLAETLQDFFILESTVLLIEFSIVTMECTDNVKVWNQSLEITVRYHQRRRDEEPVNDGGFSDPTPMEVDETPMEGDETPMEVDETPMEGDDSDSTPMEVDVSGNSTVTTPSMDDVEDTTPMLTVVVRPAVHVVTAPSRSRVHRQVLAWGPPLVHLLSISCTWPIARDIFVRP